MSAARRTWWILVLGAVWPAWAAVRTFWHPAFSNDVGDVCAALTFGLLAALALRHPAPPALRDWRRKREILGLKDRMTAAETWIAGHQRFADAKAAEFDGLAEGLNRIAEATGRTLPQCVSADAPTQPIYLSDRRKAPSRRTGCGAPPRRAQAGFWSSPPGRGQSRA